MLLGRVLSSEITEHLDGESKVMVLTVELANPDDPQTVELLQQSGLRGRPNEDDNVIVIPMSETWKLAIGVDDGIEPSLEPGEAEMYSAAEGSKLAHLKCNASGELELNGNEDFAIQFAAMKTAFDQLVSDLNALISTYNTHVHPSACTAGGNPTLVTTSTGTPSPARRCKPS